jgi:hypothetical protein
MVYAVRDLMQGAYPELADSAAASPKSSKRKRSSLTAC